MINNFVFSSVGNNTNFDNLWINDNMNYDIYIIYYGNDKNIYDKYKNKVKYIEKRKGSKFQNFKYFYDKYPDIIDKYERFFILDDDIIMNVDDINNMFMISKKYNLDICGPSFLTSGKISHSITIQNENLLLSYTNFVEVNVPLFSASALHKLMKVLDYSLIGFGIDYLYIWCNGLHKKKAYAIIHSISCINPNDNEKLCKKEVNSKNNKKSYKRELNLIKDCTNRKKNWNIFASKMNCPVWFKNKIYSKILLNNEEIIEEIVDETENANINLLKILQRKRTILSRT